MGLMNGLFTARADLESHRLYVEHGGTVQSWSLAYVARMVATVAARLQELGVGRGDRVGISAHNSLEALVLDLAVGQLRAVTAGIEAGMPRVDPIETMARFELKLFFVEKATDPELTPISQVSEWIAAMPDIGQDVVPLPNAEDFSPDDILAIKFTSGSTGPPKGLEARFGSVDASLTAVQDMFSHGPGDNILVFLPQNLLQQRYWVYSAFLFGHDLSLIHVASVSDAPRISKMAKEVRPTVIMGVPAFYDALMKQIIADGEGAQDQSAATRGSVIQDRLGGRIRYLWTGSAPISAATLAFYNDAGVALCEGYGLNETCIVAKNYPGAMKVGSAGRLVPHKTVRFDPDGVIVVGSSQPVNTRYSWCGPNDNAKIFLDTGEVYTNDIGYLDDEGYLFIQGRKDDILVLTSGFNILPTPIERELSQHPAIRHLVLFGHQQPALVAVVDYDTARASAADMRAHMDSVNARLLPEQRCADVVMASAPFSLAAGTLGNQGKPVRRIIEQTYRDQIDAIYTGLGTAPLIPEEISQ
mmetsp:Transcript_18550/g.30544  ORF Transcript_18550/g.30544 Transcript_18550/m.30544 type:complete len:529 (+) Transcript_18550:4417-6003(+)